MVQILELFGGIGSPRCALRNIGIPVKAITLCWDNLEALCQDCHNKEHHAKNVRAKRYAFTADGELIPPIQKNIFRSR